MAHKTVVKRGLSYKLALLTVLLVFVVVLLNAYTRLVDAGMDCPDWPGCYGFISVPDESHEIAVANEAYPHAPAEVHKAWPEMIHRYFAGSLGLLVVVLAIIGFLYHRNIVQPLAFSYTLFGIIIFQARLP